MPKKAEKVEEAIKKKPYTDDGDDQPSQPLYQAEVPYRPQVKKPEPAKAVQV